MEQIPKYEYEKAHGFSWYKYLVIHGGSGEKGKMFPNGGDYDYCLTYLRPEQEEAIDRCIRIWCRDNKIPFGVGPSIGEAYENYLKAKEISHE